MTSEEVVITGKIVFEHVIKPFKNATLYVRLEDVSKQDISSEIITEQTISNIEITKEQLKSRKYTEIDFILLGKIVDWRRTYIVSAHVDVDGDGRISVGDYISQAYFPVITHGNPRYVIVYVKIV